MMSSEYRILYCVCTCMKFYSFTELTEKVEILKQYLPTYEDLQGTVSALLRLQDVYKLDTSDIARGDVGGVSSTELTGEFMFWG